MKVIFTEPALDDLEEIRAYIEQNYPSIRRSFERRLTAVIAHIGRWPEGSRRVAARPSVRVMPLIRYPYKVFYQVTEQGVEVLHIRHGARREPWDEEQERE